MDRLQLDALVYPTWSNPPRLIGDLNTPAGDNSQVFSPTTGMPAITVPMGYTRNNTLPAGMTIFGRAFDEPRLIKLAYGVRAGDEVASPTGVGAAAALTRPQTMRLDAGLRTRKRKRTGSADAACTFSLSPT